MIKGIKGKTAFVTGAEKGLGKEIAKVFAENGGNVVIFGIDRECGERTKDELVTAGAKAIYIEGSVTSNADLEKAITKVIEAFGGLDFAVNCAGIATYTTSLADHSEEDFDRVMNVNLKGVFLSMKNELAYMEKLSKGKIVNITSAVGQVGNKGLSLYSASKHGVNGMTKSAALDYAHTDIRINAVSPGTMATTMVMALPDEDVAFYKAAHPINKLVDVNTVAQNVVWLCSDAGNYTTGSIVSVDGGYIAH